MINKSTNKRHKYISRDFISRRRRKWSSSSSSSSSLLENKIPPQKKILQINGKIFYHSVKYQTRDEKKTDACKRSVFTVSCHPLKADLFFTKIPLTSYQVTFRGECKNYRLNLTSRTFFSENYIIITKLFFFLPYKSFSLFEKIKYPSIF